LVTATFGARYLNRDPSRQSHQVLPHLIELLFCDLAPVIYSRSFLIASYCSFVISPRA
jgi:hypothetical protein